MSSIEPQQSQVSRRSDLIFDIGMHSGVDTRRYLSLGYDVVAVEANPVLADKCKIDFANEIAAGKLVIENVGIHKERRTLTFYRNLGCDEWSSFVPHLGERGGNFDTFEVFCITIHDLIEKYGTPYYLKIDVEGVDEHIAIALGTRAVKPLYISVEDSGINSMFAMLRAGVRQFKFVNQPKAQETFGRSSSGPFGDEIEGPWLTTHEAFAFYCANVRPPNKAPIDGWWDIHGKY
jgi:FkbM family methyltransferase